jgi:hypothetical protein
MAINDTSWGDESSFTPPVVWTRLAIFSSVGQWHTAAAILRQGGITARMQMDDNPNGGVKMLVQQTEIETARDLLHSNSIQFLDPIDDPSAPSTFLPPTSYVPPKENHPAQLAQSRWPAMLFLGWVMLAIVLLITKAMLHWIAVSPLKVTLPMR